MSLLGIDIGYSNTKFAYQIGAGVKPTVGVLPSGSAPEAYVMDNMASAATDTPTLMVGDTLFKAGIDSSTISTNRRALNANYPLTDDYLALFYRVLWEMDTTSVDTVVTGLPVNQAYDEAFKRKIVQRLTGKHQITSGRTVSVKRVLIIPQPLGAFFNYLGKNDKDYAFTQSNVVILDPGFFTADWCVFRAGNFEKKSSGSSCEAVSAVLEEASHIMEQEFGRAIPLEDLERAVVHRMPMYIFGKSVNPMPFVHQASSLAADSVIRNMQQSLRRSMGNSPDIVLLTGGGASLYEKACKNEMSRSRIITSDNPVTANAEGFCYYAIAQHSSTNKPSKRRA